MHRPNRRHRLLQTRPSRPFRLITRKQADAKPQVSPVQPSQLKSTVRSLADRNRRENTKPAAAAAAAVPASTGENAAAVSKTSVSEAVKEAVKPKTG